VYSQVEPHLESEPQFPNLADNIDMKISAPAAVLEYDSRNSLFTPRAACTHESVYLASRESLGATEEFERFQQVVMGWLPLGDQVTLGLRADYQWSSDGTPFFMRPYIKLRGVEAMRYQGGRDGVGRSRGALAVARTLEPGRRRRLRRDQDRSRIVFRVA
jgi:hypothetical protein